MTGSTASTRREMIDTNILVYAVDVGSGDKHRKAVELIERLIQEDVLTVSVQVLNEFYAVATKVHKSPSLSHPRARQVIEELAASSTVVPIAASTTFLALDAMPRHGLSFWDALIWAAAREGGASVLYTEDFQDGRDVEGVRFANPFAATP